MSWYGYAAIVGGIIFLVVWALCATASDADDKAKRILNALKRKEKEGKDGSTVATTE